MMLDRLDALLVLVAVGALLGGGLVLGLAVRGFCWAAGVCG